MTAQRLADEIRRLAAVRVHWTNWDDCIEGRAAALTSHIVTAREVGARELQRWRNGRFQALQVAVADAVFSKQKIYRTAVLNHVRPFAAAWGRASLAEFCRQPWATVFQATFGKPPKDPAAPSHNHLSTEGRVRTILAACQRLLALGVTSAADAHAWAQDAARRARMEHALMTTSGLGEALTSNVLMNVGHLRPKLDTHVRAVVSEACGIANDAPADEMLRRLAEAGLALGMHPFELDQIIWYARAERA